MLHRLRGSRAGRERGALQKRNIEAVVGEREERPERRRGDGGRVCGASGRVRDDEPPGKGQKEGDRPGLVGERRSKRP